MGLSITQRHARSARILNQIKRTAGKRSKAIQQLSSGERMTNAATDIGASAVALKLRKDIRSQEQATRNIRDAINMIQHAEGGFSEINNILKDIRSLATQAATSTYSDDDRAMMQQDFDMRLDEIDSIAKTTNWGGDPIFKLLAGGPGEIQFVVDVSASMGNAITGLKNAIASFREQFVTANINVKFGLSVVRGGGNAVDGLDNVETIAELGDPDFDTKLNALGIAGGTIDPYAAILQVSGLRSYPSASGDDEAGFSQEAIEKHLVLITDTYRERDYTGGEFPIAADHPNNAPSDAQETMGEELADSNFTVNVIAPSQGATGTARTDSKLNVYSELVEETNGIIQHLDMTSSPTATNTIESAHDAISNLILSTISYASPIPIQVGTDSEDRLQIQLSTNATIRGLKLQGVSIETQADAWEALEKLDTAIDLASLRRSILGAEHHRLITALERNVSHHVALKQSSSVIEDVNIAEASAAEFHNSLKGSMGIETLKRSFDIDRERMQGLLSHSYSGPTLK